MRIWNPGPTDVCGGITLGYVGRLQMHMPCNTETFYTLKNQRPSP